MPAPATPPAFGVFPNALGQLGRELSVGQFERYGDRNAVRFVEDCQGLAAKCEIDRPGHWYAARRSGGGRPLARREPWSYGNFRRYISQATFKLPASPARRFFFVRRSTARLA